MRYILLIGILCIGMMGKAQQLDISVPDTIREEIQTKMIQLDTATRIMYKVVFPKNYNPSKRYPVLMGLSGGNGTPAIVDYCYYTMFRSKQLDGYMKIMPVAPEGKTLREVEPNWIKRFINALPSYELVTETGWIIAGTSNGGVAAFNFALAKPGVFNKLLVMPGILALSKSKQLPKSWKKYRMLLAYGENDQWADGVNQTAKVLRKNVFSNQPEYVQTFVMKGQGHIVTPDYNIDQVYEALFKL